MEIITETPKSYCRTNTELKAATKRKPQPVYTYYFDRFGKDVMPIGAYIGPFGGYERNGERIESLITDEQYAAVRECGLNFFAAMKQDYNVNREETELSLDIADKYGVMLFICDTYLFSLARKQMRPPVPKAEFVERVAKYKDRPSFAGIVGRDEPFVFELEDCGKVQRAFDEVFDKNSSAALYMNSLSYQCPPQWLAGGPDGVIKEKWTVEEYVDKYLEVMRGAKFYSYDTYPFYNKEIRSTYFINLALVRDKTAATGIPFWGFIQGGGYYDNDTLWDVPTEGGLRWNVSTTLAYGAKGYQYFPYCHPAEFSEPESGICCLIGRYGEKTDRWYYAKELNLQSRAIEKILMNSAHEGVIFHGESPAKKPKNTLKTYRELVSVTGGDALIGCFDYKGGTALYAVNDSTVKDGVKITLEFDGRYAFDIIQSAKKYELSGDALTLTFKAGEGAMIVLK